MGAGRSEVPTRPKRLLGIIITLTLIDIIINMQKSVSPSPQDSLQTLAKVLPDSGSDGICRGTNLFIDHHKNSKRANTPRPLISMIYFTKRPGGYDMFFHSLARQDLTAIRATSLGEVMELVCVDELSSYRSQRVYSLAKDLNIPLTAAVPSKPKSGPFMTTRFNTYNALNTGVLLSRGEYVVFVSDLVTLPPSFVTRTVMFYQDPAHKTDMLGYPEQVFHIAQNTLLDAENMKRPNRLTIFSKNLTQPLSELAADGSGTFEKGLARPAPVVERALHGDPVGFVKQPLDDELAGDVRNKFWETVMATPISCLHKLNGVEEVLDEGNDSFDANIRLRCELLGYGLYMDGHSVVESLAHRSKKLFADVSTWGYDSTHSMQNKVILEEMGDIIHHRRKPVSEGHGFDLKSWWLADCPARI